MSAFPDFIFYDPNRPSYTNCAKTEFFGCALTLANNMRENDDAFVVCDQPKLIDSLPPGVHMVTVHGQPALIFKSTLPDIRSRVVMEYDYQEQSGAINSVVRLSGLRHAFWIELEVKRASWAKLNYHPPKPIPPEPTRSKHKATVLITLQNGDQYEVPTAVKRELERLRFAGALTIEWFESQTVSGVSFNSHEEASKAITQTLLAI